MRFPYRLAICGMVAILFALMIWSVAAASSLFTKPVTLLVPWGAGGGTDRVARMIAISLEKELGQKVNVVNQPGGGGAVGHLAGARARPDGYTIVMGTIELGSFQKLNLAQVSHRDFEPIAMVNWDPFALAVHVDSRYHTLSDLHEAIAKKPGVLKISGAGYGGSNHLAVLGWLRSAGLPENGVQFIPSPGGSAPAVQELLAGGYDVVITTMAEFAPMINAGRIRALAIMGEDRHPAFPDVPTFKELGIDWTFGPWRGLLYPRGVPESVLEEVRRAAANAIQGQEFREAMEQGGFTVYYMDAAAFRERMRNDEAVFNELLDLL